MYLFNFLLPSLINNIDNTLVALIIGWHLTSVIRLLLLKLSMGAPKGALSETYEAAMNINIRGRLMNIFKSLLFTGFFFLPQIMTFMTICIIL